ncbi:Ubiquitin carboxyl-terminal hydrolase [Mycena chlorophos]|uniref:Ubiquitin carboxyl-terminal hydrolase n=1 Tax=Mycena chlorophos TaxID=658473 RepID=A0A8H6VRF1_MYCCL|nr:Ubiquitin carboxyl-terminal hydrolase [Mycena chlorophos]
MLAAPLFPQTTPFSSTDGPKHSKDIDAFNKLLQPPVEFVEGSSSGALAVPEEQYEPINATPKPTKSERPRPTSPPPPQSSKNPTPARANAPSASSLYPGTIDATWPTSLKRGQGLYNSGNSCFLNSAVQCLLHTPPLIRVVLDHKQSDCKVKQGAFCMTCSMRVAADKSYNGSSAFLPSSISNKLQLIAKHMRRGRQEDSHEFLRYAIDAMQKSCLAGYPPKIDPKLAETTWVHKIFGGRLRSRVHCKACGHNSDTFDSILDLSLDIHNLRGVRAALSKFTAKDLLNGADKYKCEKCKKPVIAEKSFSIHEAPMVLTVHLKRFTPMGRKLANPIEYEERLSLRDYMSEGQHGPTYSLYGVICHAGSGPNSGHYYAYVKAPTGRWMEMNDEMVSGTNSVPLNHRNAYILFYIREKGQVLDAAINTVPRNKGTVISQMGMKKRPREDDAEDAGVKVSKPFIGPRIPPHLERANKSDPQADLLSKKIDAARRKSAPSSQALGILDDYKSDSDQEQEPTQPSHPRAPTPPPPSSLPPSSPPAPSSSSTANAGSSPPAPPAAAAAPSLPPSRPAGVSSQSFYSSAPKRKRSDSDSLGRENTKDGSSQSSKRSPLGRSLTPYGNGRLTSAMKPKGRPRGI